MNDFQRYLAEEFAEDYQEKRISRREALRLIAGVLGSATLAVAFLAACAPGEEGGGESAAGTATPAGATLGGATVPPGGRVSADDPAVRAEDISFPSGGATISAYLARPASDDPAPVILVCHENRGLTDHIRDVARRVAKAGYVGLAVDLLSRQGGTAAQDAGAVPGLLANTPSEQLVQDFVSGYEHLRQQPYVQAGRVGMTGFCFGGGVTWRVATKMATLKAAVPFYGPHPPVEDVAGIQAAVLAIYAEQDQRINADIPAIEEAMQAQGKIYEKVIYPGADHAFHNDTGSRYRPEAAQDAWARTLAWFGRYV
jgi:carboxymethylenebutenolidase